MSVFKSKGIAQKANILFLALSLGITGCTAAGIAYIHELYAVQQEAYKENTAIQNTTAAVSVANQGAAKGVGRIVLGAATPDMAAIEGYYEETSRYQKTMANGMQQLEGLTTSHDIQGVFLEIEKNEKVLREMTESLYRLGKVQNTLDAKRIYEGTYYPLSNTVQDQIQAIQYQAGQQADDNLVQLQNLRYSLCGLLGGSLILWLLAMYLLQRHVLQAFKRRLQKLYEHVTALRNGQPDTLQDEDQMDEYKEFVRVLRDMDQLMDAYMKDIQGYAASVQANQLMYKRDEDIQYPGQFERIQTSLEDISAHLVQVTEVFHSGCDAVLGNMNELNDMGKSLYQGQHDQEIRVARIIENIQQLKERSGAGLQKLTIADQYRQGIIGQVEQNRQDMEEMTDSIGQMKRISKQIADMESVMETIACQLNLLAVDAAIETKRAGTSPNNGLSTMTKRIQGLSFRISQAHIHGGKLLQTMDGLIEQSDRQYSKIEKQLEILKTGMDALTTAMREAFEVAQQQNVSIDQVAQYSDNLHELVLENAAIAEDNDQAGKDLLKQMGKLVEQIPSSAISTPAALEEKKNEK